jgi:hypothetical protein
LTSQHVSIKYAYVTSGAPGGRTTGIFKVADINKAQRILKDHSGKQRDINIRRQTLRR